MFDYFANWPLMYLRRWHHITLNLLEIYCSKKRIIHFSLFCKFTTLFHLRSTCNVFNDIQYLREENEWVALSVCLAFLCYISDDWLMRESEDRVIHVPREGDVGSGCAPNVYRWCAFTILFLQESIIQYQVSARVWGCAKKSSHSEFGWLCQHVYLAL